MAIVRAAGGARPRTAACAGSATRIAFDGSLGESIHHVSRSRSVCEQRSALQIHRPRRDDGVRVAHLVLLVPLRTEVKDRQLASSLQRRPSAPNRDAQKLLTQGTAYA